MLINIDDNIPKRAGWFPKKRKTYLISINLNSSRIEKELQ